MPRNTVTLTKYRVLTPIKTDPDLPRLEVGAVVEFTDDAAAELLAIAAIELYVEPPPE